jgi:DNA repair protein RadA/Sms
VQSLPLARVDGASEAELRFSSGIGELDNVLGGGVMKRSAVLVGGEPGIGKSTLLLQMCALAGKKSGKAASAGRVLYVTGEESAGQIKMRAERLRLPCDNIEILASSRLSDIENALSALKPVIVVIDSIQTVWSDELGPTPGTVNQLKYCSFELAGWAKEHDAALFLIAHVTKEGTISGPRVLEHMVDTVLYFEQSGTDARFLRAAKNRFGSVDELGIFQMGEAGLAEVEDPSALFLVRREHGLPPGVAPAAVLEGSRSFLVELQALTVPAKGAISRVFSERIAEGRVSRIAAVLEKALGMRFSDQDIYVNVAGGVKINDVGVELALAACLYSSRTGISIPEDAAIAGELSLAAEVLPVRRMQAREKAVKKSGYKRLVSGDSVKDLKSAIQILFGTKKN